MATTLDSKVCVAKWCDIDEESGHTSIQWDVEGISSEQYLKEAEEIKTAIIAIALNLNKAYGFLVAMKQAQTITGHTGFTRLIETDFMTKWLGDNLLLSVIIWC